MFPITPGVAIAIDHEPPANEAHKHAQRRAQTDRGERIDDHGSRLSSIRKRARVMTTATQNSARNRGARMSQARAETSGPIDEQPDEEIRREPRCEGERRDGAGDDDESRFHLEVLSVESRHACCGALSFRSLLWFNLGIDFLDDRRSLYSTALSLQ